MNCRMMQRQSVNLRHLARASEVHTMNRNKTACECRHITYGKIEDAVKAGASSFEEVQEKTGCGKSCGKCQEFIQYLVRDLLREQSAGSQE